MNRDELEAHLRSQLRELHESLPVGAPPVLPRESSGRGARTAWLLGAAGAAVLLFLAVIWVTRDNGSQTVRTGESPTNPPPTSGSVQPTTSGRSDAAPAATGLYVFQPYVVADSESTLTAVQTGPGTIGVGATLERWQGDKWVRTHDLIVGAPASYDGPTTVLPAQTEVAVPAVEALRNGLLQVPLPALPAGTYRLKFSDQVAATFEACECEPSPFAAPVPSSPDDVLIDPAVVGPDTSGLSITGPVVSQLGPGSPIAIREWNGSRWSDPLPWQYPTNSSNPDAFDPVALLESLPTFDRGAYQLAFQLANDAVVYGVFFIDRDPVAPAQPTSSTELSTSTVSPDVKSARSKPGEVLDLRTIRTPTEPSDRLRLAVSGIGAPGLNAAHISGDGRYVLLFDPNLITILRPDGTVDGTFGYRTEIGWTGVDAALGPDEVVYLSESRSDAAGNRTFRFSAIPASGANKGERVASADSTLTCVETWCGQVVVSSTGVGSAAAIELPFVSQDGAASGVVLPAVPSATDRLAHTGQTDPAFTSGASFLEGSALITVTMPDGTIRTWFVLAPKISVSEGSFGNWWLQPDGSIVGEIRTNDERGFLVDLYADGSSRGIELSPEASDAYAALRTGNSTTLVVQQDGVGVLLTYP